MAEGSLCTHGRWQAEDPLHGSEWRGRRGFPAGRWVGRCVHVRGQGRVHTRVCMCDAPAMMGLENSLNLGFKLAWVHSQLSEVLAV